MSAVAAGILSNFLGRPKEGSYLSGGQLSYNCPRCREYNHGEWDNKYNLDVTFPGARGRPPLIASCWKCGLSVPTSSLLRTYAPRPQQDAWRLYEESLPPGSNRQPSRPARIAQLPDDFELLRELNHDPYHQAAWAYLTQPYPTGRNLTPARVLQLGFGVSREPRWVNRVLLPSYGADGELNYVIGRVFNQLDPRQPTYSTTPGVKRTEIIFNEHRIDWNQPVFLVEGIFDYAAYPHNSIPLLGKSLVAGTPLEKQLRHYRPPVIVGVDMDAVAPDARELALREQQLRVRGLAHVASERDVLRTKAAGDREALLQRLAELGVEQRYWLELPRNDLGQILEHEGARVVPAVVAAGLRPDVNRLIEW